MSRGLATDAARVRAGSWTSADFDRCRGHALRAVLDRSPGRQRYIVERRVNFETGLEQRATMQRRDLIGIQRRTVEQEVASIDWCRAPERHARRREPFGQGPGED